MFCLCDKIFLYMARSMVLGNGNMMVCLDKFGQARDLYFPYVGSENHIGQNQTHKIGVFVDGSTSWLDASEWQTEISYENNSMVGNVKALNSNKGLLVETQDIVYNEKIFF